MTTDSAAFRELPVIALLSALTWALGTNLLAEWYYPLRGIGWGDLLFSGWFVFALLNPERRQALALALWQARKYILLMLAFMTWLLLSATVNCYWFGAGPTDVLAIVRMLYYCAILLTAYLVVVQYDYTRLVWGFIAGVLILTLDRLVDAGISGPSSIIINSMIVIKDPNVVGNMMGMGVLFCTFAMLKGYVKSSLATALWLAIASLTTFSKGTWLMVLAGLLAGGIAWLIWLRKSGQSFVRYWPAVAVLVAALGWLIVANAELLIDLINFKLDTTVQAETAAYRFQFALAALYTMADHPLFGLGFRNYAQVERLYPDVVPEPTENAHNAFLHFGAVGGLPALALLLLLFAYPFMPLWRALRAETSWPLAAGYISLVFMIMALSGSVQLQLVAQPFFWLFTGIVLGWYARVLKRPL
jgi:O-antigen ligase